MKHPSIRQQDILAFIKRYKREHAYAPCIREIQEACSISSTSVVAYNLDQLQRHGLIHRDLGVERSIVLPGERDLMALVTA